MIHKINIEFSAKSKVYINDVLTEYIIHSEPHDLFYMKFWRKPRLIIYYKGRIINSILAEGSISMVYQDFVFDTIIPHYNSVSRSKKLNKVC